MFLAHFLSSYSLIFFLLYFYLVRGQLPAKPMELFKANLQHLGIEPDQYILFKIAMNFPAQLLTCHDSPDLATKLYRTAKAIPTTLTLADIARDAGISVSGPENFERPYVLNASDKAGRQLMVKLLRCQPDIYDVTNKIQQELLDHEASMVEVLQLGNPSVQLVPTTVATINTHDRTVAGSYPGSFRALIMPRYVTTVAHAPKFSHNALAIGAQSMITALEYIHSKGIVHLDVKGDNVYVNQAGEWFLGDFGSSRYFTSDSQHTVITTTVSYYPTSIIGMKPCPKFDWYMLCVMLCILSVDTHTDLILTFGSPVSDSLIRRYVDSLGQSELGALLADLLRRRGAAS